MNGLPKHKTHHVSPLIKILKRVSIAFRQVRMLQRWRTLHNRIPHPSLPDPHPAPKRAQMPGLGLSHTGSSPTTIPSVPRTFLSCLHTCLLPPRVQSQFFGHHLSGENVLDPGPFLPRLIPKSSLVFAAWRREGLQKHQALFCRPLSLRTRALPFEGGPGTTGPSRELVRHAESWVLTQTS